jgi:hypothetical protein
MRRTDEALTNALPCQRTGDARTLTSKEERDGEEGSSSSTYGRNG